MSRRAYGAKTLRRPRSSAEAQRAGLLVARDGRLPRVPLYENIRLFIWTLARANGFRLSNNSFKLLVTASHDLAVNQLPAYAKVFKKSV